MRIWQEPLVQFLGLGGLLVAAYAVFAPDDAPPRDLIVIDAPVIASLEQSFAATWKRPPTASERAGLIEDRLTEEVFYREALALGLDRDDVVIRRRLRQKMEFLLQDSLSRTPPGDAELRAFFDEDPDRYRGPDRFGFDQIYLGDAAQDPAETAALLARLNGADPPTPESLGLRIMLPAQVTAAADLEIDAAFGRGFADAIATLAPGVWAGPVASGFGAHLVRLNAVDRAPPPQFDTVRDIVARDYQHRQERAATDALVARLKQGYDIVIDETPP